MTAITITVETIIHLVASALRGLNHHFNLAGSYFTCRCWSCDHRRHIASLRTQAWATVGIARYTQTHMAHPAAKRD